MNKLEALKVVIEKQEQGVTVPMALKISVGGKWHTVTIDREDKNIQKTVRVLVMMMLRSEFAGCTELMDRAIESMSPRDYIVRVWKGPAGWERIPVRAHSTIDARVMAYILASDGYPDQAKQQVIIDLALANTEIVS